MVGNDKSTINKTKINLNLRKFLATDHFVGKMNEAFEQKNISMKYFIEKYIIPAKNIYDWNRHIMQLSKN